MAGQSLDKEYDVIVIGTGPGGEGAAMQATKQGMSVAAIERFFEVGGGCTHWGTIPSKALRYSITQFSEVQHSPLFRAAGVSVQLTFPELRRSAHRVIEKQVDMRRTFYERNEVAIIRGQAVFLDPHTIEVREANGVRKKFHAKAFVIATGSRPYRPPDVDFSHPRVCDSDTILDLSFTPQGMVIYGAGVVGCEYASMFRNLGGKIDLVNTREKLLEFLDDEITDALSYQMRERGVMIRHREHYDHVEYHDDHVVLHLKSGKQLRTDVLLWANGRTGNTDDLGLDSLGIVPNARGQIDVNEDLQTTLPHVYAVGDVIGPPALASAAYVQGRYASSHLGGEKCDRPTIRDIPTGIYTSPEISSLGQTERELTDKGIPYEVGRSMFKSLARAQITGKAVGMLKLLFHRETLEILGIHCFGAQAAEIIHIGQAIMSQPGSANTLLYFITTTFNYPTMAEAYRVAALNGYNRVT